MRHILKYCSDYHGSRGRQDDEDPGIFHWREAGSGVSKLDGIDAFQWREQYADRAECRSAGADYGSLNAISISRQCRCSGTSEAVLRLWQ